MEKIGKKLKHDHTLTSILKFAIFSMVMLAPIFSVASRCLYVICNKNAKDSYSGSTGYGITYEYETNDVETIDDLVVGNIYKFNYEIHYVDTDIEYFNASKVYDVPTRMGDMVIDAASSDTDALIFMEKSTMFAIKCGGSTVNYLGSKTDYTNNYLRFVYASNFNTNYISQVSRCDDIPILNVSVDNSGTLDNAFEYSLSQIEQSSYYNWATNLGIYEPINNMVSGLGGHSVISLLLAYWSIYTAIYIVFDIIIACFVKLTHLIQGE